MSLGTKALNGLLGLLSRTESRSKLLRCLQYASLNFSSLKVMNEEIGQARQILRLLKFIGELLQIRNSAAEETEVRKGDQLRVLLAGVEKICGICFHIADHAFLLKKLHILKRINLQEVRRLGTGAYLLRSLLGVIRGIVEMSVISLVVKGEKKEAGRRSMLITQFSSCAYLIVRCLLDSLIAIYFLSGKECDTMSLRVTGVISSVMSIGQEFLFK